MDNTALDMPKHNQSELLHNQLIYKYALQISKIGVWDFDIPNNKVYHSKESREIFGYAENDTELSGVDWKVHVHPDDLEELKFLVNSHIEGKTKNYTSEHRIICKDGSYKWVLDSGKIVTYDKDGKPTRFIGTTSDITAKKEIEENMSQNLNIISTQNKKLTNFAHIVTHNLKEYAGNFQSLLGFYDEAESIAEKNDLINHLKTVSNSLTNTIDNLSDIVHQQTNRFIELETLNVNEYINNVKKLLELEIANKGAIVNNNVDDGLYLYSNAAYLESIMLNLASNALKYSHPDRPPIIDVDSVVTENQIVLTIKDNGIGIDLEKHGNSIFNLYRTFHGNDNAEGIGLYLTKNQIDALGAEISVDSEVNVGTTFTISIKKKNQP